MGDKDEISMHGSRVMLTPPAREGASLGENPAACWLLILLSSLAAVCIVQSDGPLRTAGLAIVVGVAFVALLAPWLGILALFPLAFSVATPPDGIGAKEAAFALLTVAIVARSSIECVVKSGMRDFLQAYGWPILSGALLLGINLIAAFRHHVPLADWLRGVAPFAFIFMSVPIAIALRSNPERVKWLGISVLAVAIVFCAYILGYYAWHRLWEYHWFLKIDGKMVQVPESVASAHAAAAIGPFVERITALVPSSTDAVIPLSLAIGFVLATFAEERRVRSFGVAMMALALPTILVTYTRSMLLSPLVVVGAACCYAAVYRRERLKPALLLVAASAVYGIIVIEALGLQLAWLNRGAMLFDALTQQALKLLAFVADATHSHRLAVSPRPLASAMTAIPSSPHVVDDNVATRLDEYRIAWKMFRDHPVIGNGLGAKHAMSFVRSTGDILHENVAYVHNWPLYLLMAGGLLGFSAYAFLLFRPIAWRPTTPRLSGSSGIALRAGLCTLSIYALFFAVVRLITFNLLLAAAWGIFLALRKPRTAGRFGVGG